MTSAAKNQLGYRNGIITIRTGSLKTQWLAHCRKHGKRSSDLLREFIRSQIEAAESSSNLEPTESAISNAEDFHRFEIKIPKTTHALICKRATSEGFPSANRFSAALLTVHMDGTPQLNYPEYKALIESNRQLLAIGRNLNQLVVDVKTANAKNADLSAIGNFRFGVLEQLRDQIIKHSSLVRQVLAANITRWTS